MVALAAVLALLACIVNGALSSCPEICLANYAPVCGSDGETYSNLCILEAKKCRDDSDLTKVHDGPCKQKRDAEEPVHCKPSMKNGICTLEYAPICGSDGKTYPNTCDFCYHKYIKEELGETLEKKHYGVCKEPKSRDIVKCSEHDKTGACTDEYNPVCGSDHKTYANPCLFCYAKYLAEQNGEDLRLHHHGKCVPLFKKSEVKCYESDKTGICTEEYNPICGTDGKTHANRCMFCYAKYLAEQNGEKLDIAYMGQCKTPKYFTDLECHESDKTGICTDEYYPICGTDGKTHANRCMFCYAKYLAEQNGEKLDIAYMGECKTPKYFTNLECHESDKTGICTDEYYPICGTDGKTHANRCMFCYAKYLAEQNGEKLDIAYMGECKTPKYFTNLECHESDKTGVCTDEYNPICGTDGKTHANRCMFCYAKYLAEQNGEKLDIAYMGQCKSPKYFTDLECHESDKTGICTDEYYPICGTDGKTHANRCMFCYAKYLAEQNGEKLDIAYMGECKTPKYFTDLECHESDKTGICTDEYYPICGTDGKTHANRCMFCYAKYLAEQNGEKLDIAYMGECKTPKIKVRGLTCNEKDEAGLCTREYYPICGTDGKTYKNRCEFCYTIFHSQTGMTVDHIGECSTPKHSSDLECHESDKTGVCTDEYYPICGTDGKTHANRCMFCYAKYLAEQNGEELDIAYMGECKTPKFANDLKCRESDKTGDCTQEYFPICGTDGKTHANRCMFCYAKYIAEQNGEELEIAYIGECKVPVHKKIELECTGSENSGICTEEYFPICGSNGKTYGNLCRFCYAKHQAEQDGQELSISHTGVCKARQLRSAKSEEPKCTAMSKAGFCAFIYKPVCSNEGKTYPNQCDLCADMYRRQTNGENVHLHIMHDGVC